MKNKTNTTDVIRYTAEQLQNAQNGDKWHSVSRATKDRFVRCAAENGVEVIDSWGNIGYVPTLRIISVNGGHFFDLEFYARTQPLYDAQSGIVDSQHALTIYTDLGTAALIVEDEKDGAYLPLGFASSISEAWELASDDLRRRMAMIRTVDSEYGTVTGFYKLWARGRSGGLEVVAEWDIRDMNAAAGRSAQ